ncbi:hypothetical protein ACOCEA_03730 [Maribacter sp. CXY002]
MFGIFLIALIIASIFDKTKKGAVENEIVMDSINLLSNTNNN